MLEIAWICGVGIPAAALLFLFVYLKGRVDASAIDNWGVGFDDGWKAYKESAIETGRAYNDLIDRSKINFYHLTGPELVSAMEEAPSVPAVPLDKLCEWLERYAMMNCDGCREGFGSCEDEENQEVSVCNSRERWKAMLTKWMEEQDADRQ